MDKENLFEKIGKILNFKSDNHVLLSNGWIPVKKLPNENMKVKWLCEDGVEDVGFYYREQKEFASWDLCSEKPITHWKPLPNLIIEKT
jgi:hypothetical protein